MSTHEEFPVSRKYQPAVMVCMLRRAAKLRNELLALGFTDNGGAIHCAERILNILGMGLRYPSLTHTNSFPKSKYAVFSVAARGEFTGGRKVFIEHVAPLRDLTRKTIELIEGTDDERILSFVKEHYTLVVLTEEETKRLNKINRSRMAPDRLKSASIVLEQPTEPTEPS